MKTLLLAILCLCLGGPLTTYAFDKKMKHKYNGHYVRVKMKSPHYTRVASPGNNYTYIKEDWTWNPSTNSWDWHGNRWETAPQPAQKWVPGHWRKVPGGWTWVDGHWR
jgi:hypothetical protein